MRLVTLATCNLNQWAMDFDANLKHVKQSIQLAKEAGATYRVGPELELTGYGCEDHFHEKDTCTHAWECLAEILDSDLTDNIVCDIGLPVEQGGVRYNCRAFCLNRQILLIRPKIDLANDGNYRETRWFAGWKRSKILETLKLPQVIADVNKQRSCPFGDAIISFNDTTLAAETCEELFTPLSPHIALALEGVELVSNGSGSHHQLRKLGTRIDLMRSATEKCGGVYLYANQKGCDGGRLYYDGCACVMVNGAMVAQGSQFSLADVEVVTATVDLDEVSSYRGSMSSMREQASQQSQRFPTVTVDFYLCHDSSNLSKFPTSPIPVSYHSVEEEIGVGPACWLWDYLRRSGGSGFLLPLSGGADSSAVAAMVGCMTQLVVRAIESGDKQVLEDARRVGNYQKDETPQSSMEFASRILHTVYMGSENSSNATRQRSAKLSGEIGGSHLAISIDAVVSAVIAVFELFAGKRPKYKVDGGSSVENLALQNIQARVRMVVAFLFAQLLLWVKGRPGFLLVLGSANVDEGLRGYLTKYDCSSADINPIGGISKKDLRSFLKWAAVSLGFPSLADVEAASPTAELEPIRENYVQTDEVDMGMTYEELTLYGRLRKIARCGPVSMFQNLCHRWHGKYTVAETASKVKDFFRFYSMNRHKMTTLTPSYHAENYSPEDNRFDLRQFLYNTRWLWQFRKIDEMVAAAESNKCSS